MSAQRGDITTLPPIEMPTTTAAALLIAADHLRVEAEASSRPDLADCADRLEQLYGRWGAVVRNRTVTST